MNYFENYNVDSDENSDLMYNLIDRILTEVGPRGAGTESEKKAAEILSGELKKYCNSVKYEDFEVYPRAFLGWFNIIIPLLVLSMLVFFLGKIFNPLICSFLSLVLALFCLFILYKQFLSYKIIINKFLPYKKKEARNIVGIIKPSSGEIKKRVVLGAHYDSAFIFSLIEHAKQGYVYFIVAGILGLAQLILIYLIQIIYSIGNFDPSNIITYVFNWLIFIVPYFIAFFIFVMGKSDSIFYGSFKSMDPKAVKFVFSSLFFSALIVTLFMDYFMQDPNLFKTILIVGVSGIPYLVGLFFFLSHKIAPGAVDNLTGVAPCVCAAKIINDWKKNNPNLFPKYTEVVIGIFSGEELGLQGSEFFGRTHAEEYNKIDTTCVNLESLQESRYQRIYTKENTTRTILSPEVYNLLAKCSEDLGIETHLKGMPGIAGGTDGAGLVRGGLKATSIEGINYKDYMYWYHSSDDNINIINKTRKPANDIGTNWKERNSRCAMENALKTMLLYLIRKDQEARDGK